MAHATVKLLPGRTEQQKAELAGFYKKPGYDRPKGRT